MKIFVCLLIALGLFACASGDPRVITSVDQIERDRSLVDETISRAVADRPLLPQGTPGDLSIFYPKETTSGVQLDYETWDEMLRAIVFNMGPSTRQIAPTVTPPAGTRFVLGHESPLRLEGNRVFFSFMNDDLLTALTEYKNDLIAIGDRYDIAAMRKNEQLAFWINLSNVVTIEKIAREYPVKRPAQMKLGPDKQPFDDAKLITMRGVPISLKDIRTKIIYPHWESPEVIYGFFRGDIGGPRIHTRAFTAATVATRLDANAREFVNSLRGVSENRSELLVSRVYEEAQPYYFLSWPADLKAHFRKHMRDEVLESVDLSAPVKFARYEIIIADMAGGDRTTSLAATQTRDLSSVGGAFAYRSLSLPPQVQRMYGEMQQKLEVLQRRGWARGRVVIEDVPTDDPEVE
jgi:hypothetical protein